MHSSCDGAQLEFKDKSQIALGCKMMKNGRLLAHFQTTQFLSRPNFIYCVFFPPLLSCSLFPKCLNTLRADKTGLKPSLEGFHITFPWLDWNAKMPILEKRTASDRDSQVWKRDCFNNEDVFWRYITFLIRGTVAVRGAKRAEVCAVSTTGSDSFTYAFSPLGATTGSLRPTRG